MFAGFVFTGLCVAESPFSEPTHKMGLVNFRLSLHFRGWCSTACLYLLTYPSQFPQTKSSPYFHHVSEGGPYPFPVVPHRRRRFWTLGFFSTYKSIGLSDSEVSCLLSETISTLFSSFFLCLLPQKLVCRSLYNFSLPHHVILTFIYLLASLLKL